MIGPSYRASANRDVEPLLKQLERLHDNSSPGSDRRAIFRAALILAEILISQKENS